MAKVYFYPLNKEDNSETIQDGARRLLERLLDDNALTLPERLPLKVHFGEKGNDTYIKSDNYLGIIELLQERGCSPYYTETSVLYAGERYERERHIKLAREHGFTQLPIDIADGQEGEDLSEVRIDKRHFDVCYLGRSIAEAPQMVVLAHFKGHMLAGFGGAIKQLSMGCAARAGKLAMHCGVKPTIKNGKCRSCHVCEKRCRFGALHIEEGRSYIDHDKCKGCGACISACPHKAIRSFSFFSLKSLVNILFKGRAFREGLVEYAYAAAKGKQHIYLNFCMNVTRGCDCETRHMKSLVPDVGVYASLDPVAIDCACYDAVAQAGHKLSGRHQLDYAEQLGMGECRYELIRVGR